MKVSIVVPCYNHAPYVAACIESLLGQREEGFELEIVVIDGGSTDGSERIIRGYADSLAYWVSEPDRGQTHALVKGFARTTGEILGWLNSDDLLLPGALKTVMQFFEQRSDVDVVYGDARWVDKAGKLIRYKHEIEFDPEILLWVYDYLPQPSTFWRRWIWERCGGLDETMNCAMDYDLWVKFLKVGGHFSHISQELSELRLYPEQKNQRLRKVSDEEDVLIRSRFVGRTIPRWEQFARRAWHRSRRVLQRTVQGCW